MPGRSCFKVMEGHWDSVRSLSWSPKHPDVLASGGDDHTVKIWSMQAPSSRSLVATWSGAHAVSWASGPGHLGLDHVAGTVSQCGTIDDSVIAVNFSQASYDPHESSDFSGSLFVTVADGGVVALQLQPELLVSMAHCRLSSPAEQRIEKTLYLRDFDSAGKQVVELASRFLASGDSDKAQQLLDLLVAQAAPQEINENVAEGALEDIELFRMRSQQPCARQKPFGRACSFLAP